MRKKFSALFSVSVALTLIISHSDSAASVGANGIEDFETEAVVVDASNQQSQRTPTRKLNSRNGKQFFSYVPLFADAYLVPDTLEIQNEVASQGASNLESDSCITNQGKSGDCRSFEACFPLLNIPGKSESHNDTNNYSNLQEDLYQVSSDQRCSSVVHAGSSKFADICCEMQATPYTISTGAVEDDEEPSNSSNIPKYTKIVNTWATCGEKQFQTKIIGGEESIPHEYPWMISIWGKTGRHICGAALLDNNFALTAAHCIGKYTAQDVSKIRLLIGDHNIFETKDGHHEVRSVTRIIKHKRFSFQTFANDIALLKFDHPVPYTDKIRPICLPSGMKRTDDDPALLVAGWGQTTYKGVSSSVLRKVLVPGVTNDYCSMFYNTISPAGITPEMICAGGNGVDSCIGDSGGPLIQLNENNRYEQVGIVSFGRECGTYPGVYTKVHSYLNWITVNRKKY